MLFTVMTERPMSTVYDRCGSNDDTKEKLGSNYKKIKIKKDPNIRQTLYFVYIDFQQMIYILTNFSRECTNL